MPTLARISSCDSAPDRISGCLWVSRPLSKISRIRVLVLEMPERGRERWRERDKPTRWQCGWNFRTCITVYIYVYISPRSPRSSLYVLPGHVECSSVCSGTFACGSRARMDFACLTWGYVARQWRRTGVSFPVTAHRCIYEMRRLIEDSILFFSLSLVLAFASSCLIVPASESRNNNQMDNCSFSPSNHFRMTHKL